VLAIFGRYGYAAGGINLAYVTLVLAVCYNTLFMAYVGGKKYHSS